jgi:hypothetical protein
VGFRGRGPTVRILPLRHAATNYRTAPIGTGASANIPRRSTIGTKRRLPRVIGPENPSNLVIAENGSQRGCAESSPRRPPPSR